MTQTDIQQLDYAYGKARERIEELQAQLKEAQAHATTLVDIVLEHEATIQKLSFERDAQASERQTLAAKLDAVPVEAISFIVGNSGPDYDMMMYWEDNMQPYQNAMYSIMDWLRTVKP